jgi:hypothetical protein
VDFTRSHTELHSEQFRTGPVAWEGFLTKEYGPYWGAGTEWGQEKGQHDWVGSNLYEVRAETDFLWPGVCIGPQERLQPLQEA